MSRLEQAQAEAYASVSKLAQFVYTLELNHPSFDEPIRVARGVDENIMLPLIEGGEEVEFTALAFRAVPPGFGDDGPKEYSIEIDGVSSELSEHLDLTLTDNRAIDVTYRVYRKNDLTSPGEVIEGYKLKNVRMNALTVSGTLFLEDLATQAFPRKIYDLDEYPALWALQ